MISVEGKSAILALEAPMALKDQAIHNLQHWLGSDEFKEYHPQIRWLFEQKNWAGLLDRFCQILPFGTGGRRGPVGVGPNRMNLWTLGASVQGHCEYLKQKFPGHRNLQVALAYDVRCFQDKRRQYCPTLPNPTINLSSKDLSTYAAQVYAANGITAWILPLDSRRFIATPELSLTIRFLKAHGGLNISASHNAPDDNGGKFYDERGGQPVPPDDQIMADIVDQVKVIRTIPVQDAIRSGHIQFIPPEAHQEYIHVCLEQSLISAPKNEKYQVVFSPLHGVGSMTSMEVLQKRGFQVIGVPSQMSPDGQFPNVTKTPNPEIPETMDKAEITAREHQANLVLATDPDADRLGAMIPNDKGGWRYLNGNEIAAICTCFKLEMLSKAGRLPSSAIVVTTEVTTGMISRISRHFKAQIINDLLVGFKYVSDVLWKLESEGHYEDIYGGTGDFIIATEESHGILATDKIRDKDAGIAALIFAEWGLEQLRNNRTTLQYLNWMFETFGYYRNVGIPIALPGIEGKTLMLRILQALRTNPPKQIGGLTVTAFKDFQDVNGKLGPIKGNTDLASRNVLVFSCGETAKLTLRPSGTEPKAKIYLEVCTPPRASNQSGEEWLAQQQKTDAMVQVLGDDFLAQALATIGWKPADLISK